MKVSQTHYKLFFLILLLALLAGCKGYMKMRYGMTQPKEETPESLVKFLEKNRFPANHLYMFRDSATYVKAMADNVIMNNILSHMLFDRHGKLIPRDSSKCQWAGSQVISSLSNDSTYSTDDGITLQALLGMIVPFGPPETEDNVTRDPDFTLVVIWSKFLGRYNYRLFQLDSAVSENRQVLIRMIRLNMDMQKSWNLGPEQRLKIK